jgi:mono/diheme cytochrome c family protein
MNVLNISGKLALALVPAAAIALLSVATFAPRPATATPAYAAQTKLGCGSCHTNPAGGGALTARGKKFQSNGHKL